MAGNGINANSMQKTAAYGNGTDDLEIILSGGQRLTYVGYSGVATTVDITTRVKGATGGSAALPVDTIASGASIGQLYEFDIPAGCELVIAANDNTSGNALVVYHCVGTP